MLHNTGDHWIYYDLIGPRDGEVVCMSHSLTSDHGMWAEQVPALVKAGFQVLRIDTRGHGGSSATAGDYLIDDLAKDVLSVLDALGFTSGVHMIGLSMGGMIGQVIAADHPGRLKSLMACCTASRFQGDLELMLGRLKAVRESGTLQSIVDANMERRYGPGYREANPLRWEALRQTFLGTKLDGYFGCMNACLTHDVEPRLHQISIPTLVVAGSEDPTTPAAENRAIAAAIPGAKYAEIKGGYHFPNVEFDDEFNKIMLDWLEEVRG